jgi:hemoglobin-like flavoprotein
LKLPTQSIEALRDQLFDGLMTQLRSIPIGFRVDSWLMREYPELAPLQREMAMRQIKDNLAALSPDIKKIAPKKVYESNLSMSAAFAGFWARHYADSSLSLPYKAAGYLKVGEELLAILDDVPHEPASDRDLVDAWGERLSLTGWYRWVPYDAPQES